MNEREKLPDLLELAYNQKIQMAQLESDYKATQQSIIKILGNEAEPVAETDNAVFRVKAKSSVDITSEPDLRAYLVEKRFVEYLTLSPEASRMLVLQMVESGNMEALKVGSILTKDAKEKLDGAPGLKVKTGNPYLEVTMK